MDNIIKSADDEIVDLTREFDNYVRNDSFFDQYNRGNRMIITSLILLACFFMLLISSFMGLIK